MTFSIIDFFLIIRRLWKEFKMSVVHGRNDVSITIRRLSTQIHFPKSVCTRVCMLLKVSLARISILFFAVCFDTWAPNTAKYAVPAIDVMRCYLRRKAEFVFVMEKSVKLFLRLSDITCALFKVGRITNHVLVYTSDNILSARHKFKRVNDSRT